MGKVAQVRIAVIIAPDGTYWAGTKDTGIELERGEVVHWVNMELPVPETPPERNFDATLQERA